MQVVCVDTNVLLHCDSLENLPWGQLRPGEDIWVVILPAVAREIDRLKLNGTAHLQYKARRAAQLFRRIFAARERSITLRPAHPKLDVEFAAVAPDAMASHADDAIVTEMLALGYSKSSLLLLTNDTQTAMTARDAGLHAELIPEAWLPAPEPGAAEQVLQQLYDEMRKKATVKPKLALAFEDRSGKRLDGPLQLTTNLMPPLSAGEVERCMAALRAAHPYSPRQKALSQTQRLRSVYGEVGRTYDKLYADYLADCQRILSDLSGLAALTQCKGAFNLLIDNVGGVAIKGLAMDLSIAPGQWLLGRSPFLNSAIELPEPPAAGLDEIRFPHAASGQRACDDPSGGDGTSFHWHDGFAADTHRAAQARCDALAPGAGRRVALVVELAKLGARAGEIQVAASAKNLDEPVTARLPIEVVTREISREQAIADGLIRGELAQILHHAVTLA